MSQTARIKHPAAGCTKAQLEAFERIAVNQDTGIHPATIKALLTRGLIERGPLDRVYGSGPLAVRVPSYDVPLAVHLQWCEWCAENVQDEPA